MTQRTKKIVSFALTLALAAAVAVPAVTMAAVSGGGDTSAFGLDEAGANLDLPGDESTDLRTMIGGLVNVVLGFLGIIAVIIILIGGFKYMLSGGDETKVSAARGMIVSGIIGLAIILSAWAITTFVISRLAGAVSDAGSD